MAGSLTEYWSTISPLSFRLSWMWRHWTWRSGQRVPEGAVLGSGPGKHGEEPALVLMDIGHVLGAGQLAVRDVKEVSPSGQATEEIPGGAMGLVVGHVAAGDLEIQRNRAVPGHREDIE